MPALLRDEPGLTRALAVEPLAPDRHLARFTASTALGEKLDLIDFESGARVALGSDWYVAPADPIAGIYAAVTRRTLDGSNPGGWVPEQKITVEQALRGYTYEGAYASFEEDRKGLIKAGMLADLVLIDRDLTDRAIDFMRRQAEADTPFFVYLPYTATHFPTMPHPDFEGRLLAGYDFVGDATDDHVLELAGVERARGVISALNDDKANLFVTISARALNPTARIVAKSIEPSTQRKLRRAGADPADPPRHLLGAAGRRGARLQLRRRRPAVVPQRQAHRCRSRFHERHRKQQRES